MRELGEAEFDATFGFSMKTMAPPANLEVLQRHAENVLEARGGILPPRAPELSNCYASSEGRHGHLLFWYGVPNVYLVVVLAMPEEAIVGYHRLDLNKKYGLPEPSDPTWWASSVH